MQKSPFFKGINWRRLEEGLVSSPFKPVIKNDDSVENFDKIWTDLVTSQSCIHKVVPMRQNFELYKNTHDLEHWRMTKASDSVLHFLLKALPVLHRELKLVRGKMLLMLWHCLLRN